MAYLVVTLRDGSEKQCHFKKEEDVDRFLGELKNKHPEIPTMSRKAEKKLEEAEAAEKARYIDDLSGPAEGAVKRLEEARSVLEERLDLSEKLAYAAKQKRIVDNIDPTYQIVAVVITVIAAAAAAFGIYAWIKGWGSATYLVLFGLAAIFFVAGSRILPTGRNNKAAAQKEWTAARNAMSDYLAPRRNFPVPPQYGHPIVLTRMIRVIWEGRAETEEEAFELMKDDLKKLTSDVTVTQKEYDEVVKVKPMFLVCDYQ